VEDLNDRQQSILKVIVSEYIASARPVGSDTVVEKYDLKVSPATVRNAMGALEAAGYVYHPHTSSGRIPSDRGYRFFVERLMGLVELPPEERRAIHGQLRQVQLALDEWIQHAATVLAQTTSNASIVTMPVSKEARLRHLDVIPVHEKLALVVVVLQDGVIRKQVVDLGTQLVEDDLEKLANQINEGCRGLSAAAIESRTTTGPFAEPMRRIQQAVAIVMRALDEQGLKNIWYDGVTQLLNQPEFGNVERLRDFLGLLERPEAFSDILSGTLGREGVTILIGEENPSEPLRSYTMVLTRYSVPGEAGGVIGLIGPTRMRYDRAISALKYVAGQIGGLWQEPGE
jgi:heat-inducible transcriptional repressor